MSNSLIARLEEILEELESGTPVSAEDTEALLTDCLLHIAGEHYEH